MCKYRKKPVVIEAIEFTGENIADVLSFIHSDRSYGNKFGLYILTHEGEMKANVSDYIIKGVKGEFYPCKPDIFNETYEKVEEE